MGGFYPRLQVSGDRSQSTLSSGAQISLGGDMRDHVAGGFRVAEQPAQPQALTQPVSVRLQQGRGGFLQVPPGQQAMAAQGGGLLWIEAAAGPLQPDRFRSGGAVAGIVGLQLPPPASREE